MLIGIIMGSDSDYPTMKAALDILDEFAVPYEVRVISAHRTPQKAMEFAQEAERKGFKALIAGAGMAAHLAGVLASYTNLPVIGVPIASGSLQGQDALYSTVMMPPGIPVATMAINGARNAAIFVCQILALSDDSLADKLKEFRLRMVQAIEEKDEKIQKL